MLAVATLVGGSALAQNTMPTRETPMMRNTRVSPQARPAATASPVTDDRPRPTPPAPGLSNTDNANTGPSGAIKETLRQREIDFKARTEAARVQAQNITNQRKDALRQNLTKIADETKRRAVEKIDDSLAKLNARVLEHYLEVLNKLSRVLIRIADKAERLEERGMDMAEVRTAIAEADNAILRAKELIDSQYAKEYNIAVDTENNLRRNVLEVRESLRADLKAVGEAVAAATQATRAAVSALQDVIARYTAPIAPDTNAN